MLAVPVCHEKSPSPPFTARPAAGTILATLLLPTLTGHSVHFHTSSTQAALPCGGKSYWCAMCTMSNVQPSGRCIAQRHCALTQNNERFCRGGLSGAVTITGGGVGRVELSVARRLNISMEFLSSAPNTINNTLHHCVTMSSQAGLEQLIECDTL